MRLSDQSLALKKAARKGYAVNNNGTPLYPNGDIIDVYIDDKGYAAFNFSFVRDGRNVHRPIKVHRLQAYQKYGDVMLAKRVHCRHLDGNKKNNSRNNICIGDAADNRADFLKLTKGRRSKSITVIKRSFGRYQLLLKKKVVD